MTRRILFHLVTGCRLDVRDTRHPESCIHIRYVECTVLTLLGTRGESLDQNLVHGASLVGTGPGLVARSYQQEVKFGIEHDHEWST